MTPDEVADWIAEQSDLNPDLDVRKLIRTAPSKHRPSSLRAKLRYRGVDVEMTLLGGGAEKILRQGRSMMNDNLGKFLLSPAPDL